MPDAEPIGGSYSIDPAPLVDDDNQASMYFGGLWGGQLQCYEGNTGTFNSSSQRPNERKCANTAAQGPRAAVLSDDNASVCITTR